MTQAEKQVLNAIVHTIQIQIVKLDALEAAMLGRGLRLDAGRDTYEDSYLKSAIDELAAIRGSIANLPLTEE